MWVTSHHDFNDILPMSESDKKGKQRGTFCGQKSTLYSVVCKNVMIRTRFDWSEIESLGPVADGEVIPNLELGSKLIIPVFETITALDTEVGPTLHNI